MNTKNQILLKDETSLESVKFQSGTTIDIYDDGWGPLWIMRNSICIDGVIRASSWEDAYSCWEDEIAIDGDDMPEEFEDDHEEACWNEANGFRGGMPANPRLKSLVYARDLNGEYLQPLTSKLLKELELKITISKD